MRRRRGGQRRRRSARMRWVLLVGVVLVGVWVAAGARQECDPLADVTCAGAQAAAPDPGGRSIARRPVGATPRDPAPRPAKAKPFGFNVGVPAAGDSGPAPGLEALDLVGATHHRYSLHWAGVGETSAEDPLGAELAKPLGAATPGSTLRSLDDVYRGLTDADVTPIISLIDAPRWASTLHRCASSGYALTHLRECPPNWRTANHFPDVRFLDQWAQFARAVAERYPEAVIEGPNEPDLPWALRRRNPTSYPTAIEADEAAAIQCALYRALPRDRTVLSSGLSRPGYIRPFVAAARGCYDAFSFHPYPGGDGLGAGSKFAAEFAGLRAARRDVGDRTKIWVTETGVTFTPSGDRPAPTVLDERQAAQTIRELHSRLTTMDDVGAVLFHTLRDAPIEAFADRSLAEYWFGFFDEGWKPKLRACAFLVPGTPALGACPAVPAKTRKARPS